MWPILRKQLARIEHKITRLGSNLESFSKKGACSRTNQHVSVDCCQNVRYIRAHFECLAEKSDHDDFVVLSECGVENRRAELLAPELAAAIYQIEHKNGAVQAIEFGVGAHALVKCLLQVAFFVFSNGSHGLQIQQETDNTSAPYAHKYYQILDGHNEILDVVELNSDSLVVV
jgi:hypothetical protein